MTHYEQDFYAWSVQQAELLKERNYSDLDLENLIEEIENIARSERRELVNRLAVLLVHLLKWQLQPERQSRFPAHCPLLLTRF